MAEFSNEKMNSTIRYIKQLDPIAQEMLCRFINFDEFENFLYEMIHYVSIIGQVRFDNKGVDGSKSDGYYEAKSEQINEIADWCTQAVIDFLNDQISDKEYTDSCFRNTNFKPNGKHPFWERIKKIQGALYE